MNLLLGRLRRMRDAGAELLLPSRCVACAALVAGPASLCDACAATLEPIAGCCQRCALPLAVSGEITCLGCLSRPPLWAQARAPFVFGGALADAVRRWKFGQRPELTGGLAALLAPSLRRLPATVAALIPVPLHRRRLRAREFNQASLLARAARRPAGRDLPVREWLDRVRDTPAQTTLDAVARRRNVRGAFALARGAAVSGRHVVLVDDVMTTGATAGECARVLYRGGAARVDVLLLARAVA